MNTGHIAASSRCESALYARMLTSVKSGAIPSNGAPTCDHQHRNTRGKNGADRPLESNDRDSVYQTFWTVVCGHVPAQRGLVLQVNPAVCHQKVAACLMESAAASCVMNRSLLFFQQGRHTTGRNGRVCMWTSSSSDSAVATVSKPLPPKQPQLQPKQRAPALHRPFGDDHVSHLI